MVSLALHFILFLLTEHFFNFIPEAPASSEIVLQFKTEPEFPITAGPKEVATPQSLPENPAPLPPQPDPPSKRETESIAAPESSQPVPKTAPPPLPLDEPVLPPIAPLQPVAEVQPKAPNPLMATVSHALPKASDKTTQFTGEQNPPSDGESAIDNHKPDENGVALPADAIFNSEMGPKFKRRTKIKYPQSALRMGREGKVVLRLTIDDQGHVLNIEVLTSAGEALDKAAIRAVQESTFHPAARNGRPFISRTVLPIRFKIKE